MCDKLPLVNTTGAQNPMYSTSGYPSPAANGGGNGAKNPMFNNSGYPMPPGCGASGGGSSLNPDARSIISRFF